MSLETETQATTDSEQFATFRADLRPFVFTGEQEGRMRRAVVTFGRIARKRPWRPAAIMIALHHSDCYPGSQGEAVRLSSRSASHGRSICCFASTSMKRWTEAHDDRERNGLAIFLIPCTTRHSPPKLWLPFPRHSRRKSLSLLVLDNNKRL